MEDNRDREETDIQSLSEQIDEDGHVQEEVQQELHELAQTEVQGEVQIEETTEALVQEATSEEPKTDEVFKAPKYEKDEKKARLYPSSVTRGGFFLRGALAILLGAVIFLHPDDAQRVLGILFGCAIIIVSGLNLIIG